MRIAYVCTDPGIPIFGQKGASIHAQAVLQELLRAGHQVNLITVRPGGKPLPGIRLHLVPIFNSGGSDRRSRELATIDADAAVWEILEQLQPELVYERYSLWGRSATLWAASTGVPSVLEVNAPLVQEQLEHRGLVHVEIAERVAQSAIGCAGTVICVSEAVKDWAQRVSPISRDIHVVPNGVDTRRITPSGQPVTSASAAIFTVGFVGTLKPWHGVEILIDAMLELFRQDHSWRLLLVGAGPQTAQLRRRATAAGILDAVEFTGSVAHSEVGSHLHRMDIGCAPYPLASGHYFSPLKVYEYLAAGLPVVASSVGQLPTLLDGIGVLVTPGDATEMAQALTALRQYERLRQQLRSAARCGAVERHTWQAVVARTLLLTATHPGAA